MNEMEVFDQRYYQEDKKERLYLAILEKRIEARTYQIWVARVIFLHFFLAPLLIYMSFTRKINRL